jgi:hypothetical protein
MPNYCGNLPTRAGSARSFSYLPWKPEEHGYYTFVVVPLVSVESRTVYVSLCVCMYVCMYVYIYVYMYVYYTVLLVTGDLLRSYSGHLS